MDERASFERCALHSPLLTIDEAMTIAREAVSEIRAVDRVGLFDARGRVLAHDLIGVVPQPPFDRSAMDGFAVNSGTGLAEGASLRISGQTNAGDMPTVLRPGEAVAIMTGAPVPAGADAVVMREEVDVEQCNIRLRAAVHSGCHVRKAGEDSSAGDQLLRAPTVLGPRHIALLASQGVAEIDVLRRPRALVISTGNELVAPGGPLSKFMIYDSNGPMVVSLAAESGCDVEFGGIVADETEALAGIVSSASREFDLIVITGGAAGGDADYTAAAFRRAGATIAALRVALKPGKPAVIGRLGRAGLLGLPGNPIAAMVAWLHLGRAMVAGLTGARSERPRGLPAYVSKEIKRSIGRTEFLPARRIPEHDNWVVEPLAGGSHRLSVVAGADGLIEIPPMVAHVKPGDQLPFISL